MIKRVYSIRQSVDDKDERPDIVTYYDPKGVYKTKTGFQKFQHNCCVSAGKVGYPLQDWFVPDLYASKPGKTKIEDWDFYKCSTFGAFSQRAVEALMPYLGDHFDLLPARLEGHRYVCLHCRSRIDCLDTSASEIEYYDDLVPQEVMAIEKYAFHKEAIPHPVIFAIPEMVFDLYCTDPIPKIASKAGLKGFDFRLVDKSK